MQIKFLLAAFLGVSTLSACSQVGSATRRIEPYRIDVRQGNYVDQETVAKLKKGMTRDQVRFILGTPLVVDMYRTNRWDYVYIFSPGRGEPEKRQLSVFFEADVLSQVQGDVQATSADTPSNPEEPKSRVIDIDGKNTKSSFFGF